MNKRAKIRIIGVTAIIAIILVAVIAALNSSGSVSVYTPLADAVDNAELVGQQVQVGGSVVDGSYDPTKTPMEFDICDESDTTQTGPTLHVVYDGQIPSTFGDGVVAIVTGELAADGTITAKEMVTKCPSKYESAAGAETPKSLRDAGDSMIGREVRLAGGIEGEILPVGGEYRFIVSSQNEEIKVDFEGALPEEVKSGSAVIVAGALEENGIFKATSVALDENIK